MIEVKFNGLREFLQDAREIREKCVPYAMAQALTGTAHAARWLWLLEQKEVLTVRNRYLENFTRVIPAKATDGPARMSSILGLALPFGQTMEEGGSSTHTTGRNPVPAAASAGQSPGSKRTKQVRSSSAIGKIQGLVPILQGKSRKQTIAIALRRARAAGQKQVLLPGMHGATGIYALTAGKRRTKLRLLFAVGISSVRAKPHRTLAPALAKLSQGTVEAIMLASLEREIAKRTRWMIH